MKIFLLLTLLFSIALPKEVPFTQEDRDRIIRLEEGQKYLQKQIDDLKKDTQRQFDELRTFLYWGFGILFGGMGILIGFVIWDRRTAVGPVAKKLREIEEKEEKIERVIKELARKDPEIKEIAKKEGLI